MKGYTTDRETVRLTIKALDPEGVSMRKAHKLVRRKYFARGPNFLWHVDGYDKLKPYGFTIHGAIDGYSRRILWLRVGRTNNDPKIVGSYFLRCIEHLKNVPRCVRTDRGSENIIIAGIQRYFRRNGTDQMAGQASFMFGTSTSNQRIESWWSIFKRNRASLWINIFKDMIDTAIFNPGIPFHVECARFCFLPLLQTELDETVTLWNSHRIRKVKNSDSPAGRPDILYFSPSMSNATECGFPLINGDSNIAAQMIEDPDVLPCSSDMHELCKRLMANYGYSFPVDATSAKELFVSLVQIIEQL